MHAAFTDCSQSIVGVMREAGSARDSGFTAHEPEGGRVCNGNGVVGSERTEAEKRNIALNTHTHHRNNVTTSLINSSCSEVNNR